MRPFLSTVEWGIDVDRQQAFDLMDHFISNGGEYIRTATHYPSSGKSSRFGKANEYLQAWLQANPGSKPKVLCEIGVLGRGAELAAGLSVAALLTMTELARGQFFDALWAISVARLPVQSDCEVGSITLALKELGLRVATAEPVTDDKSSIDDGDDRLRHFDISSAQGNGGLNSAPDASVIIENFGTSRMYNSDDLDFLARFSERIFGVCIRPTNPASLDEALAQFSLLPSYQAANPGRIADSGSLT